MRSPTMAMSVWVTAPVMTSSRRDVLDDEVGGFLALPGADRPSKLCLMHVK